LTLGELHRRLIVGHSSAAYIGFALLGTLPIACAYLLGYGFDRALPAEALRVCIDAGRVAPTDVVTMRGLFARPNWSGYPVMLPLALLLVRSTLRMMYGESKTSPLSHNPAYAPIRERVQVLVSDGRTLVAAMLGTLLVTIIDKYPDVMQIGHRSDVCPTSFDWSWYATMFDDLHWPSAIVMHVLTTFEQFVIIALPIVLLINLIRFNGAYLQAIYIRSRTARGFALDLDDPDRRLGLGRLSSIFNTQLVAVGCVGLLLLVSRYANVDENAVNGLIDTVIAMVKDFPQTTGYLERIWGLIRFLYPNVAQVVSVTIWAALVYSAMRAADVKLLPFQYVSARDGRVAFLREIVEEGSHYDALLARGNKHDVDAVAEAFRGHDFWPSGDTRAAESLFFCTFVMLLLLFPITPASAKEATALGLFAVASALVARAYLKMHEYQLLRVDRSLVQS
jgi:hypothetical protein